MSTLNVATVKSLSSSAPVFQNTSGVEKGQLVKAWVNFDGTHGTSPYTIANNGIRDSFNVSSVTDVTTGRYTVNLTTAMSNSNYCVISSGHLFETTVTGNAREVGANNLTTSSYMLNVTYNGSTNQDAANVFSAVFGD